MKRGWMIMIAFVLVLLPVLSACSKTAEEPKTSASPSASASADPKASASPAASASAAPANANKYNPPITLTTVGKVLPTVKYAAGDSVDNNPWTRAYESEYGIKVKYNWTVDPTQWEQKTNLMIASGDIPDFFMASGVQFKQLVEAGLLADMTDAYAKAPDSVKKVLTEGGDQPLKSATVNGKLMAIPWTGVPKEGSQMIWVRTDWLKKLNLPEPKTMDDVLKISAAFTAQDPDGNSKNDTFGLALDKDFTILTGFVNGFGAYRDIWLKDASGKLVYSTIQPAMKTALQKLQEMAKQGQIDPEFGTKAFAKVAESIVAGKIGMMYNSPYSGLYPLQSGKDKDPTMEWKAFPIVSANGQQAKNQTDLGVVGYWVVKKGVKQPEALFKMIDFWIKTFYDNKDDDIYKKYVNDGNVEIWQMNAIAVYKAFKNADQKIKVTKALETKDTSQLTGDDKGVYNNITKFLAGDNSSWGWNSIFGKDGSMGVTDTYRQNNQYIANEFITSPLPAQVEKGPALDKMKNELFTKIILGTASIDQFDKFVEDWKKNGGDEITKEVNDWYAKNK
ncbi:extracellular solute-binding protein [Paenibacillus sp. MBLB4367]|uniref:extracellular solute-binding protein n=1 Tax=Paenibacillus sp. MBLB4367 TaxID=3384767 RepID=UPI003908011A